MVMFAAAPFQLDCWDDELLSLFGIPRGMLPAIRPSSDRHGYGVTRRNGPAGAEVPLCGDLGNQQAATVGQACFSIGEAKNTYGTGNFMLLNTGETPTPSKAGLLTTVCYKLGSAAPVYALEGSVAVTGSAVQWLRDQLGLITTAAEVETLANSVTDNGGAYSFRHSPACSRPTGVRMPAARLSACRASIRKGIWREPRSRRSAFRRARCSMR